MDLNLNSKQFLQLCQSGQENRLREIIIGERNKGRCDWTSFRNSNGDTGLHLAAQNGFVGVVKLLLDCCGWAIDVMNHDSKRPLHDAAQFSKDEVVEFLIQKGQFIFCLFFGFVYLYFGLFTYSFSILFCLFKNY